MCFAAVSHFLIRKKLFNSKYPQLQITKDFAVAEKKSQSVEENMIQGRRPPIKGLHQATSQPQQRCPHMKKNSSTPKVTPLLKTPEDSQMSEPKDDNDETLLDPFAPSKIFSTKNPKSIPKKPWK